MAFPVKYSVIVPVFNSELSLEELFREMRSYFETTGVFFEAIFVDDQSRDGSWNVLQQLKRDFPDVVTAIKLSRNFGQHNATFCGLGFAKGEYVVTIDDDLQTPPKEMAKLIAAQESSDADVVYGLSERKMHSHLRNIGSSSLKVSSRFLHNSPGEGSSFRLIKADVVKKILHHQQHFIFLDEVLFWYTDDFRFAQVEHLPRKYSQSGYSFRKLIGMVANLVLYYTMLPLKVLVYGGFTLSLVTFVFGSWFVLKKIIFDVPLGFTALIVTLLFSTSIILFSLGVLGEYLSRIYQVQNRKPPFSIKRVI